ncbi:membrane cofactor protein-like isoform X4 [Brienomyrus brachyistius]|uniref:membrane cofactor protein-like isoform X4 n=1 Tax=Brienomyrus brachyistius TaxID=42636 RepID=UPI0020B3891D|nr:membrane cofactor protein-like isoform X4 [Brienomyrus brachyistius]
MLPRVPVGSAQADGVKPRRARRDCAHSLLTAALLCFNAVSVRADCTSPDAQDNMVLAGGVLSKNTFSEGSTATFQCAVGYVQKGGSRTTSCIEGKWTKVTLKCQKKSCGSPGEVTNGRFDINEGIEFGARIKAICNEGYEIVGQAYRECLDQGWSARIPTCEVVQCDEPPEISNGTIVSRPSTEYPQYRDTIEYKCNAGYTLVGENHIMCNAVGQYEPQAPECRNITCETPMVPNGHRINGAPPPYKLDHFVTFECDNGYEMDGRPQMTCRVDGWSHRPTCMRVKCGEPPEIPNGRIVSRPSTGFPQYQDTIEYECHAGYTFVGKSAITCNANRNYEPQAPECRKKSCGSPGEVMNGRFDINEGIAFGAKVKAICNEGYEIVGQAYRECLDQGWSARIPTCEVVLCNNPPEISNGTIVSRPSTEYPQYRNVIEYECNAGYTLVGQKHIMCNADGQYEPQAPECRDITCETPVVPNGHRVYGAQPPYKLDHFVTFECDNGYEMDGRAQMTCTVDSWSHRPTCTRVPPLFPTASPTKGPDDSDKDALKIILAVFSVIAALVAVAVVYVVFRKKKGTAVYNRTAPTP